MEGEIWKEIKDFPNYEVSKLGNVRNKATKKLLTLFVDNTGYYRTSIRHNKTTKIIKIHRVVASTFISNFKNKKTVNHIDHNKLNNKVNNLEWATQGEQNDHKRSININFIKKNMEDR